MNKGKNQNSILVLATLGVYLGLVLVGATPQILAQAAMTRQFNLTDEVEVKDDLDKKPNNIAPDYEKVTTAETDRKITESVQRFIANFNAVNSLASFCISTSPAFELQIGRWQRDPTLTDSDFNIHTPIGKIISITNLARAGLDSLLATDAK